jgi:hypothetical protein
MEACNNKFRVSFFTIDTFAGEAYYARDQQAQTWLASLAVVLTLA